MFWLDRKILCILAEYCAWARVSNSGLASPCEIATWVRSRRGRLDTIYDLRGKDAGTMKCLQGSAASWGYCVHPRR